MTGPAAGHTGAVYRVRDAAEAQALTTELGDVEAVPYPSGAPAATAYRDRFLLRGFAGGDPSPVRRGLVRYSDGATDLLVSLAGPGAAAPDVGTRASLAAAVEQARLQGRPTGPEGGVRRRRATLPGDLGRTTLAARVSATAEAYAPLQPDEDGCGWEVVDGPDPASLAAHGLVPVGFLATPVGDAPVFGVETSPDGGAELVCTYRATSRLSEDDVGALLGRLAGDDDPTGPTPVADRVPAPPPPATIPGLVAAAAAAHPDAVAVTHPDGELTYRALQERSAALASLLVQEGVRRGDVVGVHLPRGGSLVVAMLAIMRAGAAYVPMDPAYPRDRLTYIATDAEVSLVVTESPDTDEPWRRIDPRDVDGARSAGASVALPDDLSPTDAAYVIYTSGSTGRPKGVVVEHRNVAALLAATRAEFGLGPSDVWAVFHSYSFDFSVWEIWGGLATGGRLVLVPAAMTGEPDEFRRTLHREGVTVLNQTPSAFTQLLSTEEVGAPSLAVRLLIFGGEALDAGVLLQWFDHHPEQRCRVVNMYGITETTVHSSWRELRRLDALDRTRSVGGPLPGWSLHVVDPRGRPVPPGGFGEIHVGGAGVTRGYLGRPALTADRFRPDPFSASPGGRLYRSGDRGRARHDGEIEHHGRLDSQVKVRGYRIELDEIAARIRALPGVDAATVVLNQRGEGRDPHLDAYLTGDAEPSWVQARLAETLPSFMLPSSITPLEQMPLTGNGKLDRAGLPAPNAPATPVDASPPPPAGSPHQDTEPTDLVEQVSLLWERVLGVPAQPGDNFFLVGGNSLLAIRLLGRLKEAGLGGGPMSVRIIYENPTVTALAQALAG